MTKIVIFGTGNDLIKVFDICEKLFEIIGFVDWLAKKNKPIIIKGKSYNVFSPDDIGILHFDKVIISNAKQAGEMITLLLKLGVREHDIIVDFVCEKKNVNTSDLLKMQFMDKGSQYKRADIFVKHMAIEEHLNCDEKNQLYIEMTKKRLLCCDKEAESYWKKYCMLIDSIDKEGLNSEYSIICDEEWNIIDGAHRLTVALYLGYKNISVKQIKGKFDCKYSLDWFWENDFSIEDIKKIENVEREIFNKRSEKYIFGVIWPPAIEYEKEILSDLSYVANVSDIRKIHFESKDYLANFVRGVYAVDDIDIWKIDKKINDFYKYEYEVVTFKIEIPFPKYRLKGSTGSPISTRVEHIKKIIRGKYSKKICNYFYDNIIHIADNYQQTNEIEKILGLSTDISSFFDSINDKEYVVIKNDAYYVPDNFPKSFTIGKDVDIVCAQWCLQDVIEQAKSFCDDYALQYDLEVKVIPEDAGERIRIENNGRLIIQFDISFYLKNIKQEFIYNMLSSKIMANGYFVPKPSDEIIIIANEVILHPIKAHHIDYMRAHDLDYRLIEKSLVSFELNAFKRVIERKNEDIISERYKDNEIPALSLNTVQQNALFHYKRDVETGNYQFEKYDCECGCSFDELKTIAFKDRYGISLNTKMCPKCGLIMTNPRMNQDSYNRFYDSYYRQLYVGKARASKDYFEIQINRGWQIWYYLSENITSDDFARVKSVLEIGCSAGGILSVFKENGKNIKGIDLGSEYVSYGKKQGLDLENISSQALLERCPDEKYDLIILNHVFEHFLDLSLEMEAITRLLNDDGLIYIAVPGIKNLEEEYRCDFLRYLQNANVRHFCLGTLEMVMNKYGYDQVCGNEEIKAIFKKNSNAAMKNSNYALDELTYLHSMESVCDKKRPVNDSQQRNIEVMVQWLRHVYRDKMILANSLLNHGYRNIAIYGVGVIGKLVIDALGETEVTVKYLIDKNTNIDVNGLPVYKPDDDKPIVDVILIATSYDYWKIYNSIKGEFEVITLQDIFNEVE